MDEAEERRIVQAAQTGDDRDLWDLLERYRPRLRRMVQLRLHARLQGRIDPSDVLQESFVEASQRIGEYLDDPDVPFYVWVRFLTGQKLHQLHRHHLAAAGRDVRREVPILAGGAPSASSFVLAKFLATTATSPSEAAARQEEADRLVAALDSMKEADREIIALRNFEHLNNRECARVLDIQKSAASRRYLRALERLRAHLEGLG